MSLKDKAYVKISPLQIVNVSDIQKVMLFGKFINDFVCCSVKDGYLYDVSLKMTGIYPNQALYWPG